MNTKITRRVVLGGIIASLALGPFVLQYMRKRRKPTDADKMYAKYKAAYMNALDFPRKITGDTNKNLSKEDGEKVRRIFERYLNNFAHFDEASFDYSHHRKEGGKECTEFWYMDAHVDLKYGKGVVLKGKNGKGVSFEASCDEQGIKLPQGEICNLQSIILSFFDVVWADPEMLFLYDRVEENIDIPADITNIPEEFRGKKYDLLSHDTWANSKSRRPGEKRTTHLRFFDRKTGMLAVDYSKIYKENSSYRDHGSNICTLYYNVPYESVYYPEKIVKTSNFIEDVRIYNNVVLKLGR